MIGQLETHTMRENLSQTLHEGTGPRIWIALRHKTESNMTDKK